MKEKWIKTKEFFTRPKVIKWTVIILTVFIVVGALKILVWSIYTQDKPTFISEEIRRDVQGAIVEKIGKPLQQISNPAGTFIINAAYKSQGNAYGLDKQETKNWPTYTSDELGISFKYPEGWVVEEGPVSTKTFSNEYALVEAEHPMVLFRKYDLSGLTLTAWLDQNSVLFIGEQVAAEVPGFLERSTEKIGGYNALTFTYSNMGEIGVTIIDINGKALVLENITLSDSTNAESGDYYEGILASIK